MEDEVQRSQVTADLGDVSDLERPIEDEAGKHVGELAGQHRRGVERIARRQPTLETSAGCGLAIISHQHRDDHAGVDDDGQRSGPRAMRDSATKATASADACCCDRCTRRSSAARAAAVRSTGPSSASPACTSMRASVPGRTRNRSACSFNATWSDSSRRTLMVLVTRGRARCARPASLGGWLAPGEAAAQIS